MVEGAPGEVNRSISDVLTNHGLTVARTPDYIVQVSYAERPAGIGLIVPRDTDARWLRRPDLYRKKQRLMTLGISISAAADGRELYRASASGSLHSGRGARTHLLQALFPAAPMPDAVEDRD